MPNGGCITLDATLQPFVPAVFDELDEDNLSWNLGVNYALPGDGLLYGRVSKGYKAGSFPTASVASYTGYQPVTRESVLAYELGVKVPFLDGVALDPMPPEASKDPPARFVHVTEARLVDEAQLRSWIRQASARPGWAGF